MTQKPSMFSMHAAKMRLTLKTCIAQRFFQQHLPASPQQVGEELAIQIDDYVREQKLGYYPALDFFLLTKSSQVVENDLLETVQNIAWFADTVIQEEIPMRLRGVFAKVQIEKVQCLAFSLPPVRPNKPNAIRHLTTHYTPETFRIGLLLSSAYKHEQSEEVVEEMTRKKILRYLRGLFSTLNITSSALEL